jgi:hypothetical protein
MNVVLKFNQIIFTFLTIDISNICEFSNKIPRALNFKIQGNHKQSLN